MNISEICKFLWTILDTRNYWNLNYIEKTKIEISENNLTRYSEHLIINYSVFDSDVGVEYSAVSWIQDLRPGNTPYAFDDTV